MPAWIPVVGVILGILGSAGCSRGQEQSHSLDAAPCPPTYVVLTLANTTAVAIGCKGQLNPLDSSEQAKVATLKYEEAKDGTQPDQFFRRLSKILSHHEQNVVQNVAVRSSKSFRLLSKSSNLTAVEILGKRASALLIGRRRELESLSRAEKADLAGRLDNLVGELGYELLQHTEDEQLRLEMVEYLTCGAAEHQDKLCDKGAGTRKFDVFVFAGRIGGP